MADYVSSYTGPQIDERLGKVTTNESNITSLSTRVSAVENSLDAKYEKPSAGIPKSDLASGVRTSLGKADTALQAADITGKEDKSNKVTAFSSPTDTQYPSAKLVKDSLDTKYEKPSGGIPKSDLASAVQDQLVWEKGLSYPSVKMNGCSSSGAFAVAEGEETTAYGEASHAEGLSAYAHGDASHAEGHSTYAHGEAAHAEGYSSNASGYYSHAEGSETTAAGDYSHAEGYTTNTQNEAEHAEGMYNKSNKKTNGTAAENAAGSTLHSVGIGTGTNARSNAFEIMQNGDVYVKGVGGYDGTNAGASGASTLVSEIASKASSDTDAVAGNLAEFDSTGNPVDSGVSVDELVRKDGNFSCVESSATRDFIDARGVGDSQEILFRKSACDVEDGNALIQGVKGRTVAWNQLADDSGFLASGTSNGVTFTYSDHTITANGTASGTTFSNDALGTISLSLIAGHKYLLGSGHQGSSDAYIQLFSSLAGNAEMATYGVDKCILPCPSTQSDWLLRVRIASGVTLNNAKFRLQVFDLTLMFGAGNEPSTVAEFEAMFPNPYYPYSAGKLLSNAVQRIESVGRNVWDEEWEVGKLNLTDGRDASSTTEIRSKNYLPVFGSTTYYSKVAALQGDGMAICQYDANFNYITYLLPNASTHLFTTSANTRYIRFFISSSYGTIYNHDICINRSDSHNGLYTPYTKSVCKVGLNAINVKSPNIWDEQWEKKAFNDSTHIWEDSNTQIASKNFIPVTPSAVYYLKNPSGTVSRYAFFDADKNYLSYAAASSNSAFTVPANAYYMKFGMAWDYGTTYNNDICINESNTLFNGKYFPHGVLTFDGVKSAGSVYDEIKDGKFVQKVGTVDMGTVDWDYDSTNTRFNATLINPKCPSSNSISGNIVSARYLTIDLSTFLGSGTPNKVVSKTATNDNVCIRDIAYTDAATFKTAMSGVMLNYELATPLTFDLAEPLNDYYRVSSLGTEEATPLTDATGEPISLPFTGTIKYDKTLAAKLDDINQMIVTNIIDLSFLDAEGNYSFERNTANSYAVHNPGKYCFPLVYGNGIKRGRQNPAAWTRQGSTYTADFVNHLGNQITNAYIEKNADCVPASASLLWQTSTGVVNDIKLVRGNECLYVQFTVASVPTTNADVLLAVKDSNGDVMWSWMIWVVSDTIGSFKLKNYTNVEYEMLGLPLGAIWNANHDHYVVPYFQWGRKDPMCPPSAYNSNTNMTLYDISGNTVSVQSYGVADDSDAGGTVRSVANSIKMPDKFFLEYNTTNYHWNNLTNFNNFWNASETTNSSLADNQDTAIKTIYDPNLPGWTLPSGRFATGFTTTGSNTSTASQFNVVGSWSNGWKFKKDSTDTDGVYFPASGLRNRASGALNYVGSGGNWWTFAPSSQTNARNLYFGSGNVIPLDGSSRAYGFGVWPCRELN